MAQRTGERLRRACLLFVLILFGAGCSSAGSTAPTARPQLTTSSIKPPTEAAAPAAPATTSPAPTSPAKRPRPLVPVADRRAGLRSETVRWKATGRIHVVPGRTKAPGRARRTYTVRVEIEQGLDVDPTAFSTFVLATLNDKRSWTEKGRRRFARTDAAGADITVLLASPATSARVCLPLRTYGKLSCRHGASTAVITYYRWVKAIGEYGKNHTGYRHYVVNHEVGHVLGHRHEYCAGRGKLRRGIWRCVAANGVVPGRSGDRVDPHGQARALPVGPAGTQVGRCGDR